jgi:hypothetical protein
MIVFVHISKTAGTTVTYILRSSYGLRHCQVEPWGAKWTGPPFSSHDLQRLRRLYPNLESIAGHRVRGYVDLQENGTEFRYFTFLRHPLKRLASYYQFKVLDKGYEDAFENWIVQREWPHNRQTKAIAGVVDVDEAIRTIKEKNIFVGLAERFDESIVMLKSLVANDLNISYKRVNVARKDTIKDRLLATESTRQMLIEANQADLELYNYVEQELYPTYQQEYGSSLQDDVADYRQTQSNTFNYRNLTISRLKHYSLYKPLLYLNRRGVTVV